MTKDQQTGRRTPPTPELPRIQIVTPDTFTAIRAASDRRKKQFQEIDNVMAGIRKQFETDLSPIKTALSSFHENWKPFFSALNKHKAAKAPLRNAGILPHKTTPWELFSEEV